MSKVIVAPGESNPTHHISLSDGTTTIGLIICDSQGNANGKAITRTPLNRTALKTTSGNQNYSTFEPPWSPVAQEDWSGGRAGEDFDKDVTRYLDGRRINSSMSGKLVLGGQETYTSGLRDASRNLPGSVSWSALIPGTRAYLANKFVAAANYTTDRVGILVKRYGKPTGALTIELCANGTGIPGTVLSTITLTTSTITDIVSEFWHASWPSGVALTSGTTYWIKVYSSGGTDQNHWKVGVSTTAGNTKESSNNSSWASSLVDLYFSVVDAETNKGKLFFQYRGLQYAVINEATGAPNLYMNGDHGTADANTGVLTTLVDATKTWTVNQWAGCIVKIIRGTGYAEQTTWRTITSNTTTTLTVTPAWTITHDTTTEYVIVGSNVWITVTGHGLTAPVTDTLVAADMVYFCEGDAVNIRRHHWINSAGAELMEWADDGTNKAVYLETVRDTGGVMAIWRGQNSDTTGLISVSKATVVAWGTNLTFAAVLPFQDQWGRINGIKEYNNELWIGREGTVYAATGTVIDEIKLDEIHTAMESSNCQTMMTANAYLYFNLGSGVERYLSGTLDDVGPNRDTGLPSERQGVVSSLVAYQGRYFAAVDGNTSNYSSVLMYNGTGWNEIYRAPAAGLRITAMQFQAIPGAALDRLYFTQGNDVVWIPFPSMTIDPTHDTNYRYTHEATLTSGYIYCGMSDAYKFFKAVTLFTENLADGSVFIEVDYRIDNDSGWTPIEGEYATSPVSSNDILAGLGVKGKRIQYRLRLQTTNNSISPKIKTVVVENVSKVPIKYSYAFQYRAQDKEVNLLGEPEGMDAYEKQAILDGWAEDLTPLTMRSLRYLFDNKTVFIDPSDLTPLAEHSEFYAPRLTLVGI